MKSFRKLALVGISSAAVAYAGLAQAAGTAAGVTVSNTASVAYTVGGITQTPVVSNAATFLVDKKANLNVAQIGGAATMVVYGQTNQVVSFTVTNTTNSTQDIRLFAGNTAIGLPTTLGNTDTYGVSNIRVYVDSNNNGVYNAGVDTATYIDELAPDASKTVFVVADLPASGPAVGISGIYLTGVVATGGQGGSLGSDLVASVLDDPNAVDIVFADGAGWVDLSRDGRYSAGGEFDIVAATAQVTKTATVISDPLNGLVVPKAIPGAVVEYCIQVKNIGAGALTNVAVTDPIPANTTYVAGSTKVDGSVFLGACVADGTARADASAFDGTNITGALSNISVGATSTVRFRVTLN